MPYKTNAKKRFAKYTTLKWISSRLHKLAKMRLKLFGILGVVLAMSGSTLAACTAEEQAKCLLPDCLCPDLVIPGGLNALDTPQIVLMTFDDAVTTSNYPLYEEIIFPRVNPNGEPITATFYVTHEYNDYNLTRQLWRRGHEIALHSITHQTNTEYWKNLNEAEWQLEVIDQITMMAHWANMPADDIIGMRAPFLQTGGDVMMSAIYGKGVQYDCSRPTWQYMDPGLWPYTADYDTEFQDCQVQPCAKESYPGFWNAPMINYIGDDGYPCAMLDACKPNPDTPELVLSLLKRNFLRHYDGNRAPFGFFTHAAWLSEQFPGHKEGYIQFLDYLATLPDVYITSVARGLEWVKSPTPLSDLGNFEPWKVTLYPNACPGYNCRFAPEDTPMGSERYMVACKSCPRKYPWLGNPLGEDI